MVSIIIAARNEIYLERTIRNILENAEGEIEIIAELDGYIPDPQIIIDDPRVIFVHHQESIGQRQCINHGARLAKGKYIMKLDAHCAVDKGFDVKLAADCEYDWTVIPTMYNLDPETWKPKLNRVTNYMYISSPTYAEAPFRAQYYEGKAKDGGQHQPKNDKLIDDTMACMGPGWFMHKDRFFEQGGCDENHGSWGAMSVEVALKAWLSGGSLKVNKKTWFAHWFRGHIGWPYPISNNAVELARGYSRDLWLNDKWDKATRKLRWLVDKFNPPGWENMFLKKKVIVGTMVYGDYFIDIWKRCSLRSLFQSENIPWVISQGHELEYVVYTVKKDIETITEITKQYNVKFTVIEMDYPDTVAFQLHSFRHLIKKGIDESAMVFLQTPDFFVCKDAMKNLISYNVNGNVCIGAVHSRVNTQEFLDLLEKTEGDIPADKLVNMSTKTFHKCWNDAFVDKSLNNSFWSGVSIQKINERMLGVTFRLPNFWLMRFEQSDLDYFNSPGVEFGHIDNYWTTKLMDEVRFKFIGSSDMFYGVEITLPDKNVRRLKPNNIWNENSRTGAKYGAYHGNVNRNFFVILRGADDLCFNTNH